jgi:hypothetical protein
MSCEDTCPGECGSALSSKCMKCNPLPSPTPKKWLRSTKKITWCEVGVWRARCCALSLAMAPASSHEGTGRVDSIRVSQLQIQGKDTAPAQNPLKNLIAEVMHQALVCSSPDCKGNIKINPTSCGGQCHGRGLEECLAHWTIQPGFKTGSTSSPFS